MSFLPNGNILNGLYFAPGDRHLDRITYKYYQHGLANRDPHAFAEMI